MNTHRTTRDLQVNFCGSSFTLPAGTMCHLVKGASGTAGDLFAVSSAKVIADLSANPHDAKYRYCWIPANSVEPVARA